MRNQDSSENILLSQLRSGQPQAVAQWFKEFQPQVLGFIKSKISSDKDAEELTQEVFLNCLKHLPLFRGDSSILTWMVGIARHEVADFYRKKYAKKAISYLPLSDIIINHKIDDAHEVSEKVKLVFGQLDTEHQELLLLKYIDGKKVKDIAAELGRSVKAIESELFRAREEFKRLYVLAPA